MMYRRYTLMTALIIGWALAGLNVVSDPTAAVKLVKCSDVDPECLAGCFGVLRPYSEDYLLVDPLIVNHFALAVFLPMSDGGSSITGSTGYGECTGANLGGLPLVYGACGVGGEGCDSPTNNLPAGCDLSDELPELTAIADKLAQGETPSPGLLARAIELVSACLPA